MPVVWAPGYDGRRLGKRMGREGGGVDCDRVKSGKKLERDRLARGQAWVGLLTVIITCLLLFCLGMRHARGQEQPAFQDPSVRPAYADINQGEGITDRFDRLHQSNGFRLGPFAISPRLDLALGYDNNIYDTQHHVKDDGFLLSGAGVNATTQAPDHFLSLDGFLARTTYFSTSSNDVWSGRIAGSGWQDLRPTLRLSGDASVAREVERRDDPQSSPETEPVSYWHYRAGGDLETRGAKITFRGGISFDRVDYDSVDSTFGKFDLTYRNMNEFDASGRATYHVTEDRSFYLDVVGNFRRPDDKTDIFNVERQSNGAVVTVGTDYVLTPVLRLLATGGYRAQDYRDHNIDTVSGAVGGLQLVWQPTETTDVSVLYSHDFYESFDLFSPGYWIDVGRVSIAQQIKRDIVLIGQATIGARRFIDSDREEKFYNFEAGVKWAVTAGIVVSLDNIYEIQSSNRGNGGFNTNTTLLHFTKSF